jgi:hypothetical protein
MINLDKNADDSQQNEASTQSVPADNENGEFVPIEVPSLLTKETDPQDLADMINLQIEGACEELPFMEEVYSFLQKATWVELKKLTPIFVNQNRSREPDYGSIESTLSEISRFTGRLSFDAGYNWARQTKDIGFLRAIADAPLKSSFDSNYFSELFENRWDCIGLNWVAFALGARDAYAESLDLLTESDF